MLRNSEQFRHPNFHLYPFVDFIDELMDAADVLITKPGGVTCSEAIAKGIPMILLEPIPGQEEDNLEYLLEQRLGVAASPSGQTLSLLEQLTEQPFPESLLPLRPSHAFGKQLIERLVQEVG